LTKVTKFIASRFESRLCLLSFAHSLASPFPFAFCPNLTFSTLALLAPATLIKVWDFIWDLDRVGERGGGRGRRGVVRR